MPERKASPVRVHSEQPRSAGPIRVSADASRQAGERTALAGPAFSLAELLKPLRRITGWPRVAMLLSMDGAATARA